MLLGALLMLMRFPVLLFAPLFNQNFIIFHYISHIVINCHALKGVHSINKSIRQKCMKDLKMKFMKSLTP